MAFSSKNTPISLTLILLISSLSFHLTHSQNLDTADNPIPEILDNNDLGRIDLGTDEQQGK